MPSYVIANIVSPEGKHWGYQIATVVRGNVTVAQVPTDVVVKGLLAGNVLENAVLNEAGTRLTFTAGSASSYPRVSSLTKGLLDGRGGLVIISSVVDEHGDVIGFSCLDTYGRLRNYTKRLLLSKASSFKTCNWEVYPLQSGEMSIRSRGKAFPKTKLQRLKEMKRIDSANMSAAEIEKARLENEAALKHNEAIFNEAKEQRKEIDKTYLDLDRAGLVGKISDEALDANVPEVDDLSDISNGSRNITNGSAKITVPDSANVLPGLTVYNLADVFSSDCNKSAQEKNFMISGNLRKIAPYYSMMWDAIVKKPTTLIPTMGVTEDTLYYNPEFLSSLTIGQASFVYIHEMLHLACSHSFRAGKKNHYLWNIAADLWINEVICKDFGCKFGQGETTVGSTGGVIQTPEDGVFVSSVGIELDFAKTTPEMIYLELLQENPQYANMGNSQQGQSGQNQGQSSQGQSGQSQNGQSQNGQGQNGQDNQSIKDALDKADDAARQAADELGNSSNALSAEAKVNEGTSQARNGLDNGNMSDVYNGINKAFGGISDLNSQINQQNGNQQGGNPQSNQQGGNPQSNQQGGSQQGNSQNGQSDGSGQGDSQGNSGQGSSAGSSALKSAVDALRSACGLGQGSQGQGQSGQGQGQSGQGQGQSGQGQGQSGQGQGGQGQGQGQGAPLVELSEDKFNRITSGWGDDYYNAISDIQEAMHNQNGQGQGQSGQGQGNGQTGAGLENNGLVDDSGLRNPTVDVDVIYKGKRLSKMKMPMDIFTSSEGGDETYNTKEDVKDRLEKTKRAITKIRIKKQMTEDESGKKYTLTSGGVVCEREIDFALAPQYKWQAILKKLAKTEYESRYTFSKPKKGYLQQGIVLPAQRKSGKPTKIPGLKICVDTSGSVGEEELNRVFTLIQRILNDYNVDAEIIYWDTEVNNVGMFSTMRELLKIKPLGCGGTDPACVFEYLLGNTDFNGAKEKTRVRDISVVMFFTDGCFSLGDAYAKKFGKKTVWVIDGDPRCFDPPFGKVAPLDVKD